MPSSADTVTFLGEQAAAGLVGDAGGDGDRHDLVVELARGLGGGGALLAARAVLVLQLARDVVALGHRLGGLQHRPVDLRLVLLQPGSMIMWRLASFCTQEMDSTPPATITGTFVDDHALRRHGDGLQAGSRSD
jgi:hypothetical protein